MDRHSTNPEEKSGVRIYPQSTIRRVSCHFTNPVQSLDLQILEKWCQKFDGMVGQYNRQNSKALVSWQKQQWQAINEQLSLFTILNKQENLLQPKTSTLKIKNHFLLDEDISV